MRYFYLIFILTGFSFFSKTVKAQEGIEIYVVPALHHIHKINSNYSYDSLRVVVKNLKPDVLLVEIRPEDIDRDTAYLKKNYPLEMWAMKLWFPNHPLVGIDWLGKDIAGKPIPENYWKEKSQLKIWEKAVESDSLIKGRLVECETYVAERIPVLKEGSFLEIVNGNDEQLTLAYYQCMERTFFGTPHAKITDFYKERNISMAENIVKAVIENGKGKYVVVTGADHAPFIKMYLFKKGLGSALGDF
ncbi:MAG: hypothetical protein H0X62_04390 [Bacteroidetes bacterium]|nr:hypothetical protein [Bacteroidota bacterium]